MGLFDLFDDVKENMERNKKARAFIRDAKRYRKEGEEIYDKAYLKVFDYSLETNSRLKKHANYKKGIARELKNDIKITLSKVQSLEYTNSGLSNTVDSSAFGLNDINNYSNAFKSCMPTGGADIPSILDMFISDEDYYDAMRQRDEAKHFKEMMKIEKMNLYIYKDRMSVIRDYIWEEKNQLDQLIDKVRAITNSINENLKKNSFKNDEVDYMKSIGLIAEQIVSMLKSDFLKDDFFVSEEYQSNLEKIKVINSNLPSAPDIRSNNSYIYLKDIQKVIVVR